MPRFEVVRFGSFALIPARRELRFRGLPVPIGTRAYDLLVALIGHSGWLAEKDALIAEVWGGSIVDENNLAAQVSALRKVLAVDPALAGCLQAVPGRGYLFLAEVAVGMEPADTARSDGHHGSGDALSLVALPFAARADDPAQVDFAHGLSHTLATDLSRISGLLVIASTTAATFAAGNADARLVSRELGVRYVLTGSVQRIARTLRINAQLADGRTGLQLWSERFDGDDGDMLALQDRITGQIANAMGREVFVAAARAGDERGVDPRSFDLVIQGIAADTRAQSRDVLREQERLFARAVALDPNHADAHARLARAILLQATQLHALALDQSTLARGVAAAERAVALDPGNARTHFAMGLVHVLHHDFARAALSNEAAVALDRNFALAHNNLGNAHVHLGDGPSAMAAAEHALRLDPRGPQVGACRTTLGFAALLLDDIARAVDAFAQARAANPKLPRAHVGAAIALALAGDTTAARCAVADLLTLLPDYRLSGTMDGCWPRSPPRYRAFYEQVLQRGAALAGMPV